MQALEHKLHAMDAVVQLRKTAWDAHILNQNPWFNFQLLIFPPSFLINVSGMLGPMPPYRTLEYSYWLQALAWFSLGCDRQLRSKPVGENIENVSVLSSLFHSVFKINIEFFLNVLSKSRMVSGLIPAAPFLIQLLYE